MKERSEKLRQFNPVIASAVATTIAEDDDSPAPTGMFPVAAMSIPQSGKSTSFWKRNTADLT